MQDQDAKSKIMEVSLKLFAEKGFEGTSTRDIAKASGLNISLISYYFGGKEGLYKSILEGFAFKVRDDIESLVQQFDLETLDPKSLREAIEAVIDRLLELRFSNPYLAIILTREKVQGMPHSLDIHQNIFEKVGEKIESLIVRGQKKGFVRGDFNPRFVLCILIEGLMGYIILHDCAPQTVSKCFRLPQQKEILKKQIVSLFMEGLYV